MTCPFCKAQGVSPAHIMGHATSKEKAAAARRNGQSGGRPRKRLSDRSPHVAKLERQGKIKQVDTPTSPRESTVVLDGEQQMPDYDN